MGGANSPPHVLRSGGLQALRAVRYEGVTPRVFAAVEERMVQQVLAQVSVLFLAFQQQRTTASGN